MSTLQLYNARNARVRSRASRIPVGAAATILGAIVLAAVFAPALTSQNPNRVDLLHALAGPSRSHLLGTDGSGRDLMARLLYGARTSLTAPALVVAASVLIGTAVTVCSVWFGGFVDEILSRIVDVLLAIPGLLLSIVATAVFGTGLTVCAAGLTVAYVPYMARLIRGPALAARTQPFIAGYELQGYSNWRICVRHVLPALRPFLAAQVAINFGYALIDLAALSFLGLGVQAPAPDWGVMVASGEADILRGQPQEALYASALIVIVVIALNVIGELLAEERNEEGK